MPKKMLKLIEVFGEYAMHVTLGTLMFVFLLVLTGGVSYFTQWYGNEVGDDNLLLVFTVIKYVLLAADSVLLLWMVLYSTIKAIKEFKDESNH